MTTMDICDLMCQMKINGTQDLMGKDIPAAQMPTRDIDMREESASGYSSSDTTVRDTAIHGCEYLRHVRQQLNKSGTRGGDYLEAIFTHRELLFACPGAHQDCARGFNDVACMLEQQAWRASVNADTDAVAIFRYEAWSIAALLPAVPKTNQDRAYPSMQSAVCVLPVI